ncbi:MAG: NTP transferase domain-containing protein [candidate division Zixibacteria bacterium]
MSNPFREMNCFVLAGGHKDRKRHFEPDGELTHLEKGYRRYAAIFERVTLVLKEEQAREEYLNYPHVCDETEDYSAAHGIETALKNANSEAIFIGSADITDFPLQLAVELVRNYSGENCLAYYVETEDKQSRQPLFGIYSRKLTPRLKAFLKDGKESLADLMAAEGKLLPLPADVPAAAIGLG